MLIVMMIFGALTVASGLGVVLSKRTLHSALSLIATMFLVAVHFALLRADFLAALQIMIYAGAIMVLVVFVIMLLGLDQSVERTSFGFTRVVGFGLAACFASLLVYGVISQTTFSVATSQGGAEAAETVAGFGALLLTDYLFAFQVIALLLLAAIVAAVLLAHDPRRPLAQKRGLRAMHSARNEVSGSGA